MVNYKDGGKTQKVALSYALYPFPHLNGKLWRMYIPETAIMGFRFNFSEMKGTSR
jgi:hypothetical protein